MDGPWKFMYVFMDFANTAIKRLRLCNKFLKAEAQIHQDAGGVGDGQVVIIGCSLLPDAYQPGFL